MPELPAALRKTPQPSRWITFGQGDTVVVHTGKVFADSANTLRVPAWTRLDAGARYLFEVQGTLLTLRARIDNLTNRKYWASAGGYPDQSYLVVGQPRSVNLSLAADF